MKMDDSSEPATAEIARLFEVAAREDDAIQRLEACVADLHAVQTARTALGRFSAAELRAALNRRRNTLRPGGMS